MAMAGISEETEISFFRAVKKNGVDEVREPPGAACANSASDSSSCRSSASSASAFSLGFQLLPSASSSFGLCSLSIFLLLCSCGRAR